MIVRVFSIALLGLLLLFPSLAVQGASSGLLLWFNVVLPTLSPFIICTQMIVALDGVSLLIRPFYPLFSRLFRLSPSGAYVMLCGLLCGYPLGAKLCADFVVSGQIDREEAMYLLSICNHPSPMFLLGYVMTQLNHGVSPALLLLSLYLPVIPVSFLSRRMTATRPPSLAACAVRGIAKEKTPAEGRKSLETVILSTCETMVLIGGYIMLFSILAEWIRQLPFFSVETAAFLTGIAEITTGVFRVSSLLLPQDALLPVTAMVAFGGLSGIFQTKSVLKKAGLSIRPYVFFKVIHAGCSCLIVILLGALAPLL